MPSNTDTRAKLIIWGRGSAESEYLANDVLRIEGFLTDPASPQGGPDGKKDLICWRNNIKFVAACWFPNDSNKKDFKAAKAKFLADAAGIMKNNAPGFIFLTNVSLTPDNKKLLVSEASNNGAKICEIYQLERIRGILDSPKGYGTRLKVLDIEMTKEEQVSYYESIRVEQTEWTRDKLKSMDSKIDGIHKKVDFLMNLMGDSMTAASNSGHKFTPETQTGGTDE